jgi:hypothetical protein
MGQSDTERAVEPAYSTDRRTTGTMSAMPESRRRHKAARHRRGPTPRNPIRNLLDSLRGLETAAPMDAELTAARIARTLSPDPEMAEQFVADVEERGTTTALAVLRGLAALASDELADFAGRAADRLRAAGVPDPSWRGAVDDVRCTTAYRMTEEFGDGEDVVVIFKRPTGDRYAFVSFIDHNIGGILKDCWAVDDPDNLLHRLRKQVEAEDDMVLAKIPPSEAAGRLLRALDMTARTIGAPVSDDFVETAPLLHARVRRSMPRPMSWWRLLRADGLLVQSTDDAQLQATLDEFLAATPDGRDRSVQFVASTLVEYDHTRKAGRPGLWSVTQAEVFLRFWLPRHVAFDAADRAAVVPVMSQYVEWAARRAGHEPSRVAKTIEAVRFHGADLEDAYADPANHGPGREIVEQMIADGVDLSDDRAVSRWIDRYNRGLGLEP